MPSLTIGSRHQDGLPGVGGAFVSGGASGTFCPAVPEAPGALVAPGTGEAVSGGAIRRRSDQTAQPAVASDSSAAKTSTDT